jgi:hypothetical protein
VIKNRQINRVYLVPWTSVTRVDLDGQEQTTGRVAGRKEVIAGRTALTIHTGLRQVTFVIASSPSHVRNLLSRRLFEVAARATSAAPAQSAAPAAAAPDVLSQVAKLGELHAAGVLTDEEFAAKKADLFSRL